MHLPFPPNAAAIPFSRAPPTLLPRALAVFHAHRFAVASAVAPVLPTCALLQILASRGACAGSRGRGARVDLARHLLDAATPRRACHGTSPSPNLVRQPHVACDASLGPQRDPAAAGPRVLHARPHWPGMGTSLTGHASPARPLRPWRGTSQPLDLARRS